VLAAAAAPRRLSSPLAAVVARALRIEMPPLRPGGKSSSARKQRPFRHDSVSKHPLHAVSAELASGVAEQALEAAVAKLLLPPTGANSAVALTSVEVLSALYGRSSLATVAAGAAVLKAMVCTSKQCIRALLGFSGGDALVKDRAAQTKSACAQPDPSEIAHSWEVLRLAKRGASRDVYVPLHCVLSLFSC